MKFTFLSRDEACTFACLEAVYYPKSFLPRLPGRNWGPAWAHSQQAPNHSLKTRPIAASKGAKLAIDNRPEQHVPVNTMDLGERVRESEQSRRLAWQVLEEIRLVLEILGEQRIPREGEMKRFRAEGDFLLRALTDLVSQCRSQIHQLEHQFEELEGLVGERDLPRDILQAVHRLSRQQRGIGLSEEQLRERLNKLQELHVLPEHRVHPGLQTPDSPGEASA